jgi:hypothetical protein
VGGGVVDAAVVWRRLRDEASTHHSL